MAALVLLAAITCGRTGHGNEPFHAQLAVWLQASKPQFFLA
jgi:hypothetical protein